MSNRADLSQFLIHLTKDGTYPRLDPVHGPPPGFATIDVTVTAKNSLEDIVRDRRIIARSSFGYYALKINKFKPLWNRVFDNGGADPAWTQSVCFSETPLSELQGFYQAVHNKRNQYKKYGIAFWQERARAAGANPIFYVDSRRRTDFLPALDSTVQSPAFIPLMHLIEPFGPSVIPRANTWSDFRWEREWRRLGSYDFTWQDVAFGICPAHEITAFETLAQNRITFLDPDWTPAQLQTYLSHRNPNLAQHF